MTEDIRVRYAPSPTGHLHIGNARTALFNYLYARHHGGTFIIRVEDTDKKRNIEGGEESQLDNLDWLGIDWDEAPDKPGDYGPYRQSERQELYAKYTQQLLDANLAYYDFSTEEELEEMREQQRAKGQTPHYDGRHANLTKEEQEAFRAEGREPTIRFRVPTDKTYKFNDLVKGEIEFSGADIGGDFIIVKRDGSPLYNYAVVIDDHHMAISHVLRGDDHVANTPKQLMLYEAFGWEPPQYGHMTLIINGETGKKLSKRDENILQFIEQYRDLGYMPEAMFNFIALLGWSPEGEEEIFSREELVKIFDEDRLSKAPASFDQSKLNWISNQYMKEADLDDLTQAALPHFIEAGHISSDPSQDEKDYVKKLVGLYQEQMSYAAEAVDLSQMFFEEGLHYSDEAKEVLKGEGVEEVLKAFKKHLAEIDPFVAENVQPAIKAVQKETGQKGKNLFMPIRAAVSGQVHGPSLNDTIELLGHDKTQEHLDYALEHLVNP